MEHVLLASMEDVHGWLLGLPWVVERPRSTDAPGLRWFAVDCEPLGRRRLWLLTGALGIRGTDDLRVHVVLPTPAGRRITDAGEGAVVASLGDEHDLVSLLFEATDRADSARLARTLLLGYEASFA